MQANERWTLTVEETARLLGLSLNSTRAAIARGEIPALRVGRRLIVPRVALERLLADAARPAERAEVVELQSKSRQRAGRRRGVR